MQKRIRKIDGIYNSVIITDFGMPEIESLGSDLKVLFNQTRNEHNLVILGDLTSSYSKINRETYREVASFLWDKGIRKIIGVGSEIGKMEGEFDQFEAEFFPNSESFLQNIDDKVFIRKNILLAGLVDEGFQEIKEKLQAKSHETILEIDLKKIGKNLTYIRSRLHPETKVMVMVKAFGYGNGSYDISRFLETHDIDYLAVAYADEGIVLRDDGITVPILVLNPEISSYDAMIRYQLEPQIYNFRTLAAFKEALNNSDFEGKYPVHIKVNTGMNRLGFDSSEISELGKNLAKAENLYVHSVFSHLAASDDSAFDNFTKNQISRFSHAVETLTGLLPNKFDRHILNSDGILRHPEAQFEMVRLGLALYGVTDVDEFKSNLLPVSRLKTNISQIRKLVPGQTVGYNPKSKLEKETSIAIIPIGYADGLPRSLGNGKGKVWIQNKLLPFIGNICMDMCMVDVSEINCMEGDEVEIFGPNQTVYEVARQMGSIPYEVLTNVSRRVKRVFLQE